MIKNETINESRKRWITKVTNEWDQVRKSMAVGSWLQPIRPMQNGCFRLAYIRVVRIGCSCQIERIIRLILGARFDGFVLLFVRYMIGGPATSLTVNRQVDLVDAPGCLSTLDRVFAATLSKSYFGFIRIAVMQPDHFWSASSFGCNAFERGGGCIGLAQRTHIHSLH